MDPRWIAILLILPMVAGCIVEEDVPEPKAGDLELTISYPESEFYPGQVNVSITITLKNICDHDVLVDDAFSFGTTLFPMARASNGSEVILSYPLVDRQPHIGRFSPGETKKVSESLDPERIVIDGGEIDFDWDIPDTYSISVVWRGVEKSNHSVTSNLFPLTVGDYLDPLEGDLSFTISMDRYVYPPKPEHMNLTMVLKNVCDHPLKIEDNLWIGYTIWGNAISPNGTKIVFFPSYYPDYSQHYAPLYPGRSLRWTEDIRYMSIWEKIDGDGCEWDQIGTYTLTMVWSGVKDSKINITSNELSITIR